ncbi:MAG: TIGR03905 family TSCPD domain-containing protein [Oscillibacter sp.]|nr:TIGR03905 family TSCPD domain-containing protein [Oscillibacter sp.]
MYSFRPRGVCSQEMHVEIDDGGVIRELQVIGGCSGNLQGISALVKGMTAKEAVARLRGIRCGMRESSCPDQLARGLEQILAQAQE